MKDKLYLECFSGISGDMTVAALLDLGAEEDVLKKALQSLPISGFETRISRVKKAGLDVCDFAVILDQDYENHDHDMDYLYGTGVQHPGEAAVHEGHEAHNHAGQHQEEHGGHNHAGQHQEEHGGHNHAGHHQEEHGGHNHEGHHHAHRGLPEILNIICQADMTDRAKALAEKIFYILAEAEAKAHGTTVEEVHFHEVGAVDSVVDILAAAVCIDNLGITDVIIPVLYEGNGQVRCQHGILPIPVPAVSNIIASYGISLHITDRKGELVTPTGAAIAAALQTEEKLPKRFKIKKIGLGAGKRAYDRPSILRAMLVEDMDYIDDEDDIDNVYDMKDVDFGEEDTIYKLESNMDDCTGEALGYVMERLLEAGARDVHYIPVYMKKNRPACQINVLCSQKDIAKLEHIIFAETTTIGIRRQKMERSILKREVTVRETAYGDISYKVCTYAGGKRFYPEYESVVQACRKHQVSYQEVYREALAAAENPAELFDSKKKMDEKERL